jgi:hypothetical protein
MGVGDLHDDISGLMRRGRKRREKILQAREASLGAKSFITSPTRIVKKKFLLFKIVCGILLYISVRRLK